MGDKKRMIVGISGASGILYGVRLLEILRTLEIETHLIVTSAGHLTRAHETELSAKELRALAHVSYAVSDVAAPLASGSFRTMGMIVAPCSVHTLGAIVGGVTSNLLTRAADVVLKERRRLVLLVREFPLHAGHLKNMLAATEMGAIVAPPVPAFYTRPASIEDIVDQTVGRVLDLFDLEVPFLPRWGETLGVRRAFDSSSSETSEQALVQSLGDSAG
jgi:4-hydroxy-3-polyprenylbenzoate decarboxylase